VLRRPKTGSLLPPHPAGDIASNPANFKAVLAATRRRFHATFIVAGNHDLWVSNSLADQGVVTSIDKLAWIHQVAEGNGDEPEGEEDTEDGVGGKEEEGGWSEEGKEGGPGVPGRRGESEGDWSGTPEPSANPGGSRAAHLPISPSSSSSRRGKVFTGPVRFHTPRGERLLILPLLSWYHASWDTEPDLPAEVVADLYEGRPTFEQRWADFRCCKWPEEVLQDREDFVSLQTEKQELAVWFARQNEIFLADTRVRGEGPPAEKTTVISFSHFLPREELCPEKRFLLEPMLPKVIGSTPLRKQVEALRPDLHVFGHTHIPIDLTVQGIRYLQWPLGSVGEQSRQTYEMGRRGPVLVFDEERGGLVGTIPTRWGAHYREAARNVLETELAPWVKKYWERK